MAHVFDGEIALRARGLRKSFGDTEALRGVDLEIRRGTVLGLLGPNGAGKTTCVRILTTLLKPDAGEAEIAGVNVLKDPEKTREVIGLSGQYAALDEILTGRENLTMFGQLYHLPAKIARARADELLAQFSLTDAANRQVKTYSGGMRRRLDLAASLIVTPPVVVLDEPTTGLDPRSRNEMWHVIERLVAEGTTVLLTTQYLEEADRLADQIVVIDKGTVIARGTADELKNQLGGERLEIGLPAGADIDRARGVMNNIAHHGGAGEADIRFDEESRRMTASYPIGARGLADAVRALDAAGIELTDFALRRPTLDDVFLTLTGHAADDATPEERS